MAKSKLESCTCRAYATSPSTQFHIVQCGLKCSNLSCKSHVDVSHKRRLVEFRASGAFVVVSLKRFSSHGSVVHKVHTPVFTRAASRWGAECSWSLSPWFTMWDKAWATATIYVNAELVRTLWSLTMPLWASRIRGHSTHFAATIERRMFLFYKVVNGHGASEEE